MTVGELRALLAPHNEHRQVMVVIRGDDYSDMLLVADVELDNSSQYGAVVAIQGEYP